MNFLERLESVYRAERGRLFTYALSLLGDRNLSEDVVQDVFRKLCQSPVDANDLKAFVYRCVRNRALDLLRQKVRKGDTAASSSQMSIYATDRNSPVGQGILSEERARQVERALYSLRDGEREVVVLHVYSGMTFKEISQVLESPPGTVASWYRRALGKLRQKLEGDNEL
jgi:RNA polymerase sigma-70 factor (ECF subfamily)